MSFVTARGLNKSYLVAAKPLHVLRDLDLSVERGEMVAIVGASGVGKSTLLHVLGGLDRPDSGEVVVGDVNVGRVGDAELVAFRNRHVGFVFQFHHLLPEFSAIENAEMPLRIARMTTAEARPHARESAGARGAGRAARASAGDAVGRRAAAGRGRPRAGEAAFPAAGRRANRRPRRNDRRRAARAAADDARRVRADGRHRDAQSAAGAAVRPRSCVSRAGNSIPPEAGPSPAMPELLPASV